VHGRILPDRSTIWLTLGNEILSTRGPLDEPSGIFPAPRACARQARRRPLRIPRAASTFPSPQSATIRCPLDTGPGRRCMPGAATRQACAESELERPRCPRTRRDTAAPRRAPDCGRRAPAGSSRCDRPRAAAAEIVPCDRSCARSAAVRRRARATSGSSTISAATVTLLNTSSAVSSGRMGTACWSTMRPASGSPPSRAAWRRVSCSPLMIAQFTGTRPRYFGSREPCMLNAPRGASARSSGFQPQAVIEREQVSGAR